MTDKTGGPAFPIHGTEWGGMTLRDYFAAAAMEGLLASNVRNPVEDKKLHESFAIASCSMADALPKWQERVPRPA